MFDKREIYLSILDKNGKSIGSYPEHRSNIIPRGVLPIDEDGIQKIIKVEDGVIFRPDLYRKWYGWCIYEQDLIINESLAFYPERSVNHGLNSLNKEKPYIASCFGVNTIEDIDFSIYKIKIS